MPEDRRTPRQHEAGRLNRAAEQLRQEGRFAEAEPLYEEALALYEAAADRGLGWAICLDNLGLLRAGTHRLPEAVELHRRALDVFRQHPDNPGHIGISANNLGAAYAFLGNEPAAREYLEEAQAWHERSGRPSVGYAGTLANLARLASDPLEAEQLLRRARDMCAQVGPDAAPTLVSIAISLGSVLTAQRRWDEAQELLEDCVRAADTLLPPLHPDRQLARANLGELHRQRGNLVEALEILEPIMLSSASDGAPAPNLETLRANLALLYEELDRPEQSLPLLAANVLSEMRRLDHVMRSATEVERLASLRLNRVHLLVFLGFAFRQQSRIPELTVMALEFWVRRKGAAAQLMAAVRIAETSRATTPDLTARIDQMEELRRQIDKETRVTSSRFIRTPDEWIERTARLRDLQRQAERIERAVAPELAIASTFGRVDGPALAASLPNDGALLEFCALLPRGASPAKLRDKGYAVEAGYLAFVVRGDERGRVHLVDLGPATHLEQLVTDFREALAGGAEGRDLGAIAEALPGPGWQASLRERLAATIGDPLRALLGGVRQLVVSPDAALCLLPFHALPLADSGYWLDEFEIAYVSTARDLLHPARTASPAPRQAPVVLAAPAFSADGMNPGPFQPLPGAAEEGQEVGRRLGVRPLLGREATKAVVSSVAGPLILHLATHGFFAGGPSGLEVVMHETGVTDDDDPFADPEFNRLARLVGADARPPVRSATIAEAGEGAAHPGRWLLDSGVALAGANDARARRQTFRTREVEAAEQGELLASDLARLDLRGTSLVVLSACETGLGRVDTGEGVWGLQLAVRLAGAASVVMSLWRVEDQSTVALMCEFYDRLLTGKGKAAALRGAMLRLKEESPDPRTWAPFLCWGDPGPLPGTTPAAVRAHA
jgi:CHAT domain-containing protein/tetratricopeptide (TPR) repeat protein